jgi:hydroxypyruvate reductase
MDLTEERKQHIRDIAAHAIAAADPYNAVKKIFTRSGDGIAIQTSKGLRRYLLKAYSHIWVVGCGKAGAPMSAAIEEAIGDRISGGIVVVKDGFAGNYNLKKITLVEAAHPEPDERGVAACRDISEVLKKAVSRHLVLALVSGGGSALWPLPVPQVPVADKQEATRLLLACGAEITEINTVRKHLSLIKGGWAAHYAHPADVVVLTISDVINDDLETIASGPFAPDPSTFPDAWHVLARYNLLKKMPASVTRYLQDGMTWKATETPKPGNPEFLKVIHVLCAGNRVAINAAGEKARLLGYDTQVNIKPVHGECRDAAKKFCSRIKEMQPVDSGKPRCTISGGETTVALGNSKGKGGRNQEFALASAIEIQYLNNVTVASFGTDGNDGPTDAAGAIADNNTVFRASSLGLDSEKTLSAHDSYPLFEKLNDLIVTGPTMTNVMDIQIAIAG